MPFKQSQITKRYKFEEFRQIPPHKLIGIVRKIKAGAQRDEEIMASWENHFKNIKVPYVITTIDGVKVLWKEKRA